MPTIEGYYWCRRVFRDRLGPYEVVRVQREWPAGRFSELAVWETGWDDCRSLDQYADWVGPLGSPDGSTFARPD
jgi:hypothetical protein